MITRSTSSSFSRQYSCARSSWRTMSRSSSSSMRTTTIGRSPEMPYGHSPGAPRSVAGEHVRRRPQRRIRVQDPVGEALEEVRLVGVDAEVVELDLGLGPGEDRGPLERGRLAVLVGEVEDLARVTRRRRWRRSRGRSRPVRAARGSRRLKIGSSTAPTRVRQRASVDDRDRRPDRAARGRGSGPGRSRTG